MGQVDNQGEHDIPAHDWDSGVSRMVLDSIGDGICVADMDHRIVVWNRAAERMTGWSAAEMIGRSYFDEVTMLEDLDGNPLSDEESCPLHRAMFGAEASTLPDILFAKTKHGRRIPVQVSVAPVRTADGSIIGGVESFRDLSLLVQDLRRSRVIQEHAMEAPLPDDPHVQFAVKNIPQEYISGDFCRVEQIEPGIYGIMLADVMGHGVAAALHTMQIRSTWEEARALLVTPGAFMGHLNENLYRLTEDEDFFATAFYGVFDAERMILKYVTGGHPAPFLFRGGEMFLLPDKSVALGLVEDVTYTIHEEQIVSGDRMLVYSDGVIECANSAGVELGQSGLSEIAVKYVDGDGLDDTLDTLTRCIRDYCGHLTFLDDVSFVLMAVR